MYAVIKTGGKQYRVAAGNRLKVERLAAEVGAEVQLGEVLAMGEGDSLRLGSPTVQGALVTATVVGHGLGEKVVTFKMRRRKNSRRTRGHRQGYTEIEIKGITG